MEIVDFEHKKFRTRLMGLDSGEVESFLQDLTEELRRLKADNEQLRRELQAKELELRGHKERETTLRNVLVTAQKNAEQTRANAEREARLIISESEVKAEKIIRDAGDRLIKIEREISELKRHRIQFGARMRGLLDSLRQVLDEDSGEKIAQTVEEKRTSLDQPEEIEPSAHIGQVAG